FFQGPTGYEKLLWPRMVTGGENYTSIYLLAMTAPIINGGMVYQGLNGALLYSRSTDSGETWDIQNQILPGMDSTEYNGFTGDCYAFVEPMDNIIAFVVGSTKNDMFLMKSDDYGQTFEKTIIWDNPYDTILPPDTFYCVDGSVAVALDMTGKAHVAFGIVSAYYNNGWGLNRYTDGVGYWNEDREPFSSDINALNPEGGFGSEMIPDHNLIGWSQDLNGNGQLDFLGIGQYGGSHGISGMVQIVIDELNRIFVCFTSVTEGYDQGAEHYRRLWFRTSVNSGNTWGQFYHYAVNDSTSIFNDYIFPSMAANSDDHIYCIFQRDYEPSLNIYLESPMENYICFAKIPKDEIVGIREKIQTTAKFEVSQNVPNPFSKSTTIKINLREPADFKLEVINTLGEKVYELPAVRGNIGLNKLTIQADKFIPGIYFYSVTAGINNITKKMIIE
ncbi:MAG: T9SS type A sorting domain-containing protein, partial [Bacteroidales bacterium]|nr:T9SS type A sorting domain-containing protein [Bacteroidales bacterium]